MVCNSCVGWNPRGLNTAPLAQMARINLRRDTAHLESVVDCFSEFAGPWQPWPLAGEENRWSCGGLEMHGVSGMLSCQPGVATDPA